jgi:hypothetical protein
MVRGARGGKHRDGARQITPVISTLGEKGFLRALCCTESHGNNQCQIESPISAFWTDPLRVLYAPDTLEVFTSLPAPCRHHPTLCWVPLPLMTHGRHMCTRV